MRVKRNLLERDDLNRLLDYLLVRSILRRSQATQNDIDALADEAKQHSSTPPCGQATNASKPPSANKDSTVSSSRPGEILIQSVSELYVNFGMCGLIQ